MAAGGKPPPAEATVPRGRAGRRNRLQSGMAGVPVPR